LPWALGGEDTAAFFGADFACVLEARGFLARVFETFAAFAFASFAALRTLDFFAAFFTACFGIGPPRI